MRHVRVQHNLATISPARRCHSRTDCFFVVDDGNEIYAVIGEIPLWNLKCAHEFPFAGRTQNSKCHKRHLFPSSSNHPTNTTVINGIARRKRSFRAKSENRSLALSFVCVFPFSLFSHLIIWDVRFSLQTPENCSTGADCLPMIISWEGAAEIQSGDVLIVEIDDTLLLPADISLTARNQTTNT